jgi:hypothetical protein
MPENVTPDTAGYLVLGLVAIAAVVFGYLASLYIRYRNLQKDQQLIEQLRDDG